MHLTLANPHCLICLQTEENENKTVPHSQFHYCYLAPLFSGALVAVIVVDSALWQPSLQMTLLGRSHHSNSGEKYMRRTHPVASPSHRPCCETEKSCTYPLLFVDAKTQAAALPEIGRTPRTTTLHYFRDFSPSSFDSLSIITKAGERERIR